MAEELPLPPEENPEIPEEPKKEVSEETKPKNIWKILTIIFAILLIISYIKPFSGDISEGEAKTTALTHINSLLQGRAIAEVTSIKTEGNLYKLEIDINGEVMDSYMTKDGSLLFPSALDLTEPIMPITGTTTQEIPKTKTPEVKLFVMSQCPFGTIAEAAINPVLDLLENKFNFGLYFIANENQDGSFRSLHGQPEVDEDMRQLCVAKYYPETYMNYISCINKDYQRPKWIPCLEENNMEVNKIRECFEGDEGKELFSENIKEANKLGVGGSPTLIINDVTYQGQRTAEGYKQAVCEAFEEAPEECEEVLSTQQQGATGSC